MKDDNIELEAKLTSIHPLINGSFSLIFRTNSLESSDKLSILQYHQKTGKLYFSKDTVKDNKVSRIDNTEQTQLQRLKTQLKQKYDILNINKPFQEWYIEQLNDVIKSIRDYKIIQ